MNNLELNIKGRNGKQIIAYEINSETKKIIEDNSLNASNACPINFLENNSNLTLISHGISARPYFDFMEFSATLKNISKTFYPLACELEPDHFFKEEILLEEFERCSHGASKGIKFNDVIWVPQTESFQHTPGYNYLITNGSVIVFEINSYSYGNLHTSFKVRDDFKFPDLKIVTDYVDVSENQSQLSKLYYSKVFHRLFSDQDATKCSFDEDAIRAIEYDGKRYDFDLDYQESTTFFLAFEKNDNQWIKLDAIEAALN